MSAMVTLECDLCGDDAADGDASGRFVDGAPTRCKGCGATGSVCSDDEAGFAYVSAEYCGHGVSIRSACDECDACEAGS